MKFLVTYVINICKNLRRNFWSEQSREYCSNIFWTKPWIMSNMRNPKKNHWSNLCRNHLRNWMELLLQHFWCETLNDILKNPFRFNLILLDWQQSLISTAEVIPAWNAGEIPKEISEGNSWRNFIRNLWLCLLKVPKRYCGINHFHGLYGSIILLLGRNFFCIQEEAFPTFKSKLCLLPGLVAAECLLKIGINDIPE